MKNKKIIKIFIILILVIAVITLTILIINKKNRIDDDVLNKQNLGIITCSKEIPVDNDFYKFYEIEEIQVEENIAKEQNSLFKIIYNDKDNYEGFKTNEKVKNPHYDDENLTIIYDNIGKIDLKVDEYGQKIEIGYKKIIEDLENEGYVCS